MYGLIGAMRAVSGHREELIEALTAGSEGLPGNVLYAIAADAQDPDVVWVVEHWRSREDHQASLALPQVQEAIARGRPHIAGFESRVETEPR
ncbi:putative quinol monooxygenase [Demequina sp. NBRC 110056]|uniref:putative quinol monooxygenase n=1 Tax=Demequina sp. NBRC 110056 TaxID=1570345 RepID=UPI000A05BD55|nr:antibiotic biosynthesis monooxygenase [Demequina sp. NBRC 110056]